MAITATHKSSTGQRRKLPRARRRGVIAYVVAHAISSVACLEASLAQEHDRVTIDARRCLELASPDERLACFETQVDKAQNHRATTPATADVPTPSAPRSIPTVDVARLPEQGASADAPDASEWVGNIASLQERAPRQYLITLDSGQIWQQQVAELYPLRVGQRVRIYKSRFGLRLHADGVNGFIRVERIR
jgi:hypothetical protein